jgi:hypothetical protein
MTTIPVDVDGVMVVEDETPTLATTAADVKAPSRRRRRWILPLAIIFITFIILLVIFLSVFLTMTTSPRSTVCGPGGAGGNLEGIGDCHFSFDYWDSGGDCTYINEQGKLVPNQLNLKLLFFTNGPYDSIGSHCSSSSETDYSICEGSITNQEQDQDQDTLFQYTTVTFRNQTVELSVNGISYDFWNGGAVFLIDTSTVDDDNGKAVVTRIEADLTDVYLDKNAAGIDTYHPIETFAQSNEQISVFCSIILQK